MSAALAEILRLAYAVNREQLAYHEIGHGLVAAATGRRVTRLTINAHGGLTTSSGPASPLILLLVSLAGDRAEHLAPGCVRDLIGFGPSRDREDVELALDLVASGTLERDWILEDARRQVDALLLEHRVLLDRLARMLLERRTLDAYEIGQILGSRDSGGDWR